MNIAALLDYGPRLKAAEEVVSKRSGEKNGKRYSQKMIDRYRAKSVNGRVWSTLLHPSENTEIASLARNLSELAKAGILKPVGRYDESRSSNKPVMYEWAN
jgi:hypothetical protein